MKKNVKTLVVTIIAVVLIAVVALTLKSNFQDNTAETVPQTTEVEVSVSDVLGSEVSNETTTETETTKKKKRIVKVIPEDLILINSGKDVGEFVSEKGKGEWFNYYVEPRNVVLVYNDGTEKTVSIDDFDGDNGFDYVDIINNQSFDNQWTVGEYYSVFKADDLEAKFKVIITDTPLVSVEAEPLVIAEGTCGEYDTLERYYEYDFLDAVYKLKFADGTILEGTGEELCYNGFFPEFDDTQSADNPWGVGEHKVKFEFMGKTAYIDITIEESPIKSIKVEPVKIKAEDYREIVYSDDGLKENRIYDSKPEKLSVTLKDGTVVVGSPSEIIERFGEGFECWSNQFSSIDAEEQWTEGNTYKAYLYYLGEEVEYEVKIVK